MKAAIAISIALVCGAAHAGSLLVTVTDKEGKAVPDAVVVVKPAQRVGGNLPVLPQALTIVQEKMQFSPAVSIVAVGAKLTFQNNDSWDHHVRGVRSQALGSAPTSAGFELRLDGRKPGLPARQMEIAVEEAGPMLLSCHIHGSMRGHVFVAASPWTAKTSAEGLALFELPDGPAQVSVWHPEQLLDLPGVAASIGSAPARLGVQLQVVPRRRRI
jgi:plastocyanin